MIFQRKSQSLKKPLVGIPEGDQVKRNLTLPGLSEVFRGGKWSDRWEGFYEFLNKNDLNEGSLFKMGDNLKKLPCIKQIDLNPEPRVQKKGSRNHEGFNTMVASPQIILNLDKISTSKLKEVSHQANLSDSSLCDSFSKSKNVLESFDYPKLPSRPQSARFHCSFPKCQKFFSTPIARDSHLRYHYKDRPHHCHLCSKSYTQNGNLIKHLRSHATPNIDRRRVHTCEFCNRGYTEKYNLKILNSITILSCLYRAIN
ncbi:unnamed protein product [Moneuplotes crassus]|uniref:C2H2-type domain-containing protein n=1 Tax=Euplotes crassus TaxID=5936 RepID=A0AAD1XZ62_EUPCR|nr:unnamed protein product [Moneuplotes crassus]